LGDISYIIFFNSDFSEITIIIRHLFCNILLNNTNFYKQLFQKISS
jgi:hypothetical protein